MKHGPIIYDDFWPDRHRSECDHGNYKVCAECDAEGERAMAELGRPYYMRGLCTGVLIGASLAMTISILMI